jgi:hypothetical protein
MFFIGMPAIMDVGFAKNSVGHTGPAKYHYDCPFNVKDMQQTKQINE